MSLLPKTKTKQQWEKDRPDDKSWYDYNIADPILSIFAWFVPIVIIIGILGEIGSCIRQ
jgi:hypothetical protein